MSYTNLIAVAINCFEKLVAYRMVLVEETLPQGNKIYRSVLEKEITTAMRVIDNIEDILADRDAFKEIINIAIDLAFDEKEDEDQDQ